MNSIQIFGALQSKTKTKKLYKPDKYFRSIVKSLWMSDNTLIRYLMKLNVEDFYEYLSSDKELKKRINRYEILNSEKYFIDGSTIGLDNPNTYNTELFFGAIYYSLKLNDEDILVDIPLEVQYLMNAHYCNKRNRSQVEIFKYMSPSTIDLIVYEENLINMIQTLLPEGEKFFFLSPSKLKQEISNTKTEIYLPLLDKSVQVPTKLVEHLSDKHISELTAIPNSWNI